MKTNSILCLFILKTAFFSSSLMAQVASGGTFQLDQTVIAPGGTAGGGTFTSTFVIGQPLAASGLRGGRFQINTGFFANPPLAPTAAGVSLFGRAMSADGRPLMGVHISLLNSAGVFKTARTNTFGYFRFDDVPPGQTYILAAVSKDHQFASQVFTVMNDITDLSLIALDHF